MKQSQDANAGSFHADGSVMTWNKWTLINDPPYGTDALINARDGTPESGLIQIAERTKHGWRVANGNIPLDDVTHFAVITSPNDQAHPQPGELATD